MYRIYYDTGFKIFLMCGSQRPIYDDEIPILVTPSLTIAKVVLKNFEDLKNEQK